MFCSWAKVNTSLNQCLSSGTKTKFVLMTMIIMGLFALYWSVNGKSVLRITYLSWFVIKNNVKNIDEKTDYKPLLKL